MQLHFPLLVDGRGRLGEADRPAHVRQLIEQLLFTEPGERVNRPDFGCGLLRAVFGAIGTEERVALQFTTREQIERWLGELIETRNVAFEQEGAKLHIRVDYVDRAERRAYVATYEVTPA